LETLERLSSKSGVVAALAMDRSTSTVLASTGNLLAFSASAVASSTSVNNTSSTTASGLGTNQNSASAAVSSTQVPQASASKTSDGFDLASRIWHYVNFSGQLVQDMDAEVGVLRSKAILGRSIANLAHQDDLKLLRLRTKKHEFMIVPDPKYIFVVVHEVSS
jgi:dynein light chain roadblock-type